MNALTRVRRAIARRLFDPSAFATGDAAGGSTAGVFVSEDTALRLAAVYACVRVLSESVASLPLILYRRTAAGKQRATEHPLYSVLHDRPNPRTTSSVFRETLQSHTLLHGNGYARIERKGAQVALYPLPAGKVRPDKVHKDRVVFDVQDFDGKRSKASSADLLHVPGLGFDGVVGTAPLEWARETIGLGLALQKHGSEFFGSGARPDGVLSTDRMLKKEQRDLLLEGWTEAHKNQRRTAVLHGGLKYDAVAIPPEQAQFVESRKFSVSEIARIFRVPPHMIGDLERATFSNIEQQSVEFVIYSLRPWLVRWEQEINAKLLTSAEQATHVVEFNVEGLLRGDAKTRSAFYKSAVLTGWMSRNEVRERENLNQVDGLSEFLTPMNMSDADDRDGGNEDANRGRRFPQTVAYDSRQRSR